MIYETEKYIDVLIKHDITPNQFLFAWMVYNKQWREIKRYMSYLGTPIITEEDLQHLMDKDVIINFAPKNNTQVHASDLHVTELFAGEMAISEDEAWDEFFTKYPGKLIVNGNVFSAKGLTRSDEQGCREKYQKTIKKNRYKHVEIMSALDDYIKQNNGHATMKIDKFVIGEFWNEVEKGRGNNYAGTALF